MEKRKANIIIGKSGGTASKSSKTYKISLPNSWIDGLQLNENNKGVEMFFDGERIIIEKQKSPEDFINCKMHLKHDVREIKYYNSNNLSTYIIADFTDKTLLFRNYTDICIDTAFGNNDNPDWDDFQSFLRERCIPESRAGLKYYLNELDIDVYDPIAIIEKTGGRMAEDNHYVEIKKVN